MMPSLEDVNPPDPELEVPRDRERFRLRQEALARADVEDTEQELTASDVPKTLWPPHTSGRQRWDALQAREAAEKAVEYEGERLVRLLTFQLAAAAVPPPRRRWWKQLRRRLAW